MSQCSVRRKYILQAIGSAVKNRREEERAEIVRSVPSYFAMQTQFALLFLPPFCMPFACLDRILMTYELTIFRGLALCQLGGGP
jgi:hypothetical protein